MIISQLNISKILIDWYLVNQRNLPWRDTGDPYRIWVSEIILQQTRVNQGLPYYLEFVKQFPDIESLASAPEDAVMKVWQGLGYYTRARKMMEAARIIHEYYNNRFPASYEGLLNIPGIGPYTAAAIASIAFHEAVPVIDGNVIRVLSRFFGIDLDPGSSKGKRSFHQKATDIMDTGRPGTFNQAIMEFGSTRCLPRNPLCESCPLQVSCYAFNNNKLDTLPVKKSKKTTRKRYFHYLVFLQNNRVLLRRRDQKDIWQSLYEFPLIETRNRAAPEKLLTMPEFDRISGVVLKGSGNLHGKGITGKIKYSALYKHILSHRKIFARFYLIPVHGSIVLDCSGLNQVNVEDIPEYPVPRLMDKFFNGDTWSAWRSRYC